MLEAENSIPMHEKTEFWRYNKKVGKKESICVWIGHALINLIYGHLDQELRGEPKQVGINGKPLVLAKQCCIMLCLEFFQLTAF